MARALKVGEVVKYVDKFGTKWDALVQMPWSDTCCNLVYVGPGQAGEHGMPLQQVSSIVHRKLNDSGRNCWLFSDEAEEKAL